MTTSPRPASSRRTAASSNVVRHPRAAAGCAATGFRCSHAKPRGQHRGIDLAVPGRAFCQPLRAHRIPSSDLDIPCRAVRPPDLGLARQTAAPSPIQARGPGPGRRPGRRGWRACWRSGEGNTQPMHSVSPALSARARRFADRSATSVRARRDGRGRSAHAPRQLRRLRADLVQRQPDPLGEDDEHDPPERRPRR